MVFQQQNDCKSDKFQVILPDKGRSDNTNILVCPITVRLYGCSLIKNRRFLLNDYVSSYEQLLEKLGKCNMNIRRLRFHCIEIYKTLNDLNPNFMKEILEKMEKIRLTRDSYKLNLSIPRRNQDAFGTKSCSSTDQKFGTLYQLISKLQKALMLLKI